MKKTLVIILLAAALATGRLYAQSANGIGFMPSNKSQINGWAIGWYFGFDSYMDFATVEHESIQINGLQTNVSVFQFIGAGMLIVSLPFAIFRSNKDLLPRNLCEREVAPHQMNGLTISCWEHGKKFSVRGVQLSLVGAEMGEYNGLSISGLYNESSVLRGVELSLLSNSACDAQGVQLAIFNDAQKIDGLQFGIANRSKDLRGIQIGLWNINQKRKLPFINWNF